MSETAVKKAYPEAWLQLIKQVYGSGWRLGIVKRSHVLLIEVPRPSRGKPTRSQYRARVEANKKRVKVSRACGRKIDTQMTWDHHTYVGGGIICSYIWLSSSGIVEEVEEAMRIFANKGVIPHILVILLIPRESIPTTSVPGHSPNYSFPWRLYKSSRLRILSPTYNKKHIFATILKHTQQISVRMAQPVQTLWYFFWSMFNANPSITIGGLHY